MPTKKDFNLVDTQMPANQGGDWMQIHNQNTTLEISATTGADLDKADQALKSGAMRERLNRKDKGGNL